MTGSTDRSPLMAPLLSTQNERRPADSVVDFYSPLDSAHNSDEEDAQVRWIIKLNFVDQWLVR